MKIKFTRTPTITKAVIATVLFTILWGVTNVNLPSCNDPGAVLNSGGAWSTSRTCTAPAASWR